MNVLPDPVELTRHVIDACLAMGFAAAGVAEARPSDAAPYLRQWLEQGQHGEMVFMTELLEERLDITRLLPGAQSVVIVADQYDPDKHDAEQTGSLIARYARGRDYHVVIKDRLHALCDRLRERFPGTHTRAFVDTGPVLEREQAARAGLGFVGKHTLLINPALGSYLLLGGFATTLRLAPTRVQDSIPPAAFDHHCGGCTRCIDACPTSAITPFQVDARRCISYLTLEHASLIADEFWPGIGDRLIGCDVCQEVCPFNAPSERSTRRPVNAAYRADRSRLSTLEVLNWSAADRQRELSGTSAKRATLDMIRRSAVINACNALSTHPDPALLEAITRIAADPAEPEVIRETARHALARLSHGPQ